MDNERDCSGGSDCGCRPLPRRDFLKAAGVGAVSLTTLGGMARALAGPFSRPRPDVLHFVPTDKKLDAAWIKSLYERGAPHVWRGAQLNQVGMPVGGIAAGQLYLCGDGSLGDWKIFRETYPTGYGRDNYRTTPPERLVEQGFAVMIEGSGFGVQGSAGGAVNPNFNQGAPSQNPKSVWELNRQGFDDIEFTGEYPIGRVRYRDPNCPVRVELEAFSPFIPLNARDSAIPGTLFRVTLTNDSPQPVRAGVLSWLENAVCFHSRVEQELDGQRRTQRFDDANRSLVVQSARAPTRDEANYAPDIVIADFEGETYGDWKAEGEAFGTGPARGAVSWQTQITGFEGKGLVNTFAGSDATQGTLTSPPFTIERRFLQFLIGGGNHPNETCVNLLVGEKVVRTATGKSREALSWTQWDVKDLAGKSATIQIVDRFSGGWGHVNVDQIMQTDRKRYGDAASVAELEDFVTMALGIPGPALPLDETIGLLEQSGVRLKDFTVEADEQFGFRESRLGVVSSPIIDLSPGTSQTITFALAWHAPNRKNGVMYANWFGDARAVANYLLDNRERLTRETHEWHRTYYDSTLPRWLLDRLGFTVANLATGTCHWWKNGRFWAWEGVGCCAGTCTHVWNYAHAMARLFPELERSAREMQDLDAGFRSDGLVGFRAEAHQAFAADGQCGTVLKCYREHQCSADDGFLQRNWPKIKQVLEYVIREDGDKDGLLEGRQHNTFDIDFYGPNTFVGALYLAALRAGEEMAREIGDEEFATRCRAIFESGSRKTVDCLWNGEYFFQEVNLKHHPKDQYGDGCLSDQLFGQGWAHHVGLGYLYPREHVRKTLEAVWKYNWAPDCGPHNALLKPERWFVSPGEAGLFTCTWPKSAYLKDGVRYREEVWTGIEYQVAGHMIWEGMLEEGLAIVRAVHDRYDPAKHNPYNEVECGDHYARALASWGVYTALLGFEYHGPRGQVGFAPRISPESFRAAFTVAEGWGTFEQNRAVVRDRMLEKSPSPIQANRIRLVSGRLRLTSISLELPRPPAVTNVRVHVGERTPPIDWTVDGERLRISLRDELVLTAGQTLEITVA